MLKRIAAGVIIIGLAAAHAWFGCLMVSKRLIDLDLALRRLFLMLLLAVVPSLLIVLLLSLLQHEKSIRTMLLSFLLVMTLLTVTLYCLEYAKSTVEKVVFPKKFMLRTSLKNIATRLRSVTGFYELKELVLADIVRTLQVYGAAIVFRYPAGVESIVEGEELEKDIERLIGSDVRSHPDFLFLDINRHEEYECYLILSKKKTGTRLGVEEELWLNLILSYLAVGLDNIYLIRKLALKLSALAAQIPDERHADEVAWFRKMMFELQERERYRIASDLHDTTIQDVLFVKSRIQSLLLSMKADTGEYKQLLGAVRHLEQLNDNLRQSLFELNPLLLQRIGLLRTLEKMIDIESGACAFAIELMYTEEAMIEAQEIDMKRHLFRMIQELLNNAKKHSQAHVVRIGLSAVQGRLLLQYEDDGAGFDVQAAEEKARQRGISGSGFGMEQMRGRVIHLRGEFELESSPGQGVKVKIRIPLKEVIPE